MTHLRRIAFIGNSLPRHCGIATFTTDLQQAVAKSATAVETCVVAMTDNGNVYDYPSTVRFQIMDGKIEDYLRAANFLNAGRFDAVSLQHEFGIFGGEAGSHIMALLSRLTMPVITTLHTVLAEPAPEYSNVLDRIAEVSSKVVVMAEKGRRLLRTVYGVPAEKIEVIPHGIPDFAFVESDEAKAKFGYSGRPVILTFGLLSPTKGIEVMIDAMPLILKFSPNAVYIVLGATHPHLIRDQGEVYRESLMTRVRELGIQNNVVFLNRFVDQETLLAYISMCDVYVTPYLNESQMTSGTLAYSFGLGKAVVSTPYWHAQELLADGHGILVPFGDAIATGTEIAALLTGNGRLRAMRERAYASSRYMIWERSAERHRAVFDSACQPLPRKMQRLKQTVPARFSHAPPEMHLGHFLSMCDDTGLFQHAVYSVSDRYHGYCVDDNARALLLACALNSSGEEPLPAAFTARFASFVQHAWNPGTKRFRNFMSFDRRWLEECGSEDSHGRTLWALGECTRSDACPTRRQWAASLFAKALPAVKAFRSPRAWAFTLLGLDNYCAAVPRNSFAERVRILLADKLISLLVAAETKDWVWFEDGLAYDNARLPQALIVTGSSTGVAAYADAGLRSLRWLMTKQTAPSGVFRPIGTDSFGVHRKPPQAFDQQPLEATATISACLAAWRVDDNPEWRACAARAFAWFLGGNDLSVPLADIETGACRDGLHFDRPNENRGGESVVSYLLSLAEIRQLARISGDRANIAPFRAFPVQVS